MTRFWCWKSSSTFLKFGMDYSHWTNFFENFSEVICVDTVSHTNSDKRPLFSINWRDSFCKMFIISRMILRNERAYVFRRIFQIVLSTLFPCYLLSQVSAIITDGCQQEYLQIDMAREIFFKNTLRIRSGFHLVRMGWTRHVI